VENGTINLFSLASTVNERLMNHRNYTIRLTTSNDEQRWDAYVTSHPEASPYHLSAWKNAVAEAYQHKGYYLVAEQGQQIAGVFPLIHLQLPFFVNELTSLPFCDVGNILSDNAQVAELLLLESIYLGRKLKTEKLQLRGNSSIPPRFNQTIFPEKTAKMRMFLSLPQSSEALIKGFKAKLRSQIGKAEKNGLVFSWETADGIDAYYSVFSKNMRDLGSPVHSKKWFRSIMKHYGDNAKMGLVSHGSQAIGCCILLAVGRKISIPWASTLRKYNSLSPNMLLYWNVLKYSADAGFTTFDFGRSSEGEGTYRFKQQWGAEPTPLSWHTTVPPKMPSLQNDLPRGMLNRDNLAKLWNKLPLVLANSLGPHFRKYISL
jgi:FemAB-related protein (PEP-CTERM system-associated)